MGAKIQGEHGPDSTVFANLKLYFVTPTIGNFLPEYDFPKNVQ
jgi:hypothetical protein